MGMVRQWFHSILAAFNPANGAILVQSSFAQTDADLLAVPFYHGESLEDVTWDEVECFLVNINNPAFTAPYLLNEDLTTAGVSCRIDYKGSPGKIVAIPSGGIPTKLSQVDDHQQSGVMLVPLTAEFLATMTPGKKYILRTRQKASGHTESSYHDQIITW